jgi:hypothetical protein
VQHRAGFRVPLRRKKKQLHPFLGEPDLGNATRLFIFKNAATDCLKIGEFCWDIVMLQPVFHKKQIAQCPRFSAYRVEHHRPRGSSHGQQFPRRRRSRKVI